MEDLVTRAEGTSGLLRLVAGAILLLASLVEAGDSLAIQTSGPNIVIHEWVSDEDAALVTEGIHLAEIFYRDELTTSFDRDVAVQVRSDLLSANPDMIAMSLGPVIVVYTGSPG